MTETLQEYSDARGMRLRVDREEGVIRGVKILGLQSRNGRTYLPEALAGAAELYEGAKVNVNHAKGSPLAPRDYQDRIGTIRNVAVRAHEGLFGDFHFNPKHSLSEQLVWDAEHAPENVGFSHNVQARTAQRDGRVVVETITQVQSVDLVADPATTQGLFETVATDADASPTEEAADGSGLTLADATAEDVRRHRPELIQELLEEPVAEMAHLREEVEQLRAAEAVNQKRTLMRRLLSEYKLPLPETDDPRAKAIASDRFLEAILAAPDEEAMRAMVRERAQLVECVSQRASSLGQPGGKPLSRDQCRVDQCEPVDAKRFVEAIT